MGIFLSLICVIAIFLYVPFSKTKTEFKKLSQQIVDNSNEFDGVFTEKEIDKLPKPVQKYFNYCGFIGKPKMSYMNAFYKDVPFLKGKEGRKIKIDYNQYNLVSKPFRVANIESSLLGIPFEGNEYYYDNVGRMKGVIAKTFTLFDVQGPEMNESSLITYLAECLIVPNAALQNFIEWEEIDDLHAKGTISYKGTIKSGIFTFNEEGAMTSFTTNDRWADKGDGTFEKVRWSALCSNYKEKNGIKQPTNFKAVWHYDDGDLVYFDSSNMKIEFR